MSNHLSKNKRINSFVLVLCLLLMLLPTLQPNIVAEEVTVSSNLPVLNDVIEGTVRFGSFNYMGDKGNRTANDGDERDGVDYVSTFYYSDDFFSRSAVNPNVTSKTMDWTALEDFSMATLSINFTIACYGSSENTFPTNWTNKDKNGKRFLTDCGFDNLFVSPDFNKQTGRDTLGYMFGSKKITVYDQKTHHNKTFTLVAVGVRGGGYGAEWASNLTIGDSNGYAAKNKSYSLKYRHKGFDDGAQKVLSDLKDYTGSITGDVKYWVVGYSRAGAIANLVAGDITKNASAFKTSIDDVYGYTFEAAAGALKTEDPDGTTYPNIHNVINAMDAVPRVSPSEFNHCRVGVDYRLPYHDNTTSGNNTTYYNNMRTVLPMVARIADLYNRNCSGKANDATEDPVIKNSDPVTYPYNRTIQMKSFGLMDFNTGFVSDVSNANSSVAPSQGLYLDEFLDKFVTAFIKSIAWDYEFFYTKTSWGVTGYYTDNMTHDPDSHEQQYVKNYQEALRTLAYLALKNPGLGMNTLNDLPDKIMDAGIGNIITDALGAGVYYGEMNMGIRYNRAVDHLISPMTSMVKKILEKTDIFDNSVKVNGKTDLDNAKTAIEVIMPVLTWLYCEDHHNANGEYLGTVFDNINNILVTHIPELGVSWLMSLDDVFTSDYREVTLPKATEINMYVFRSGIDDEFIKANEDVESNADAMGQLVSSVVDGIISSSKDDRITATVSGDNVTIRYPGNLDLRLDVTPLASQRYDDIQLEIADYAPVNVVNAKSDCERASIDSTNYNVSNIQNAWVVKDDVSDHSSYTMTTLDNTPDADKINTLSDSIDIPMTDDDTLHIMTWHGSNQVGREADTTYDISLDRAPKTVVADYSTKTVIEENASKISEDSNGFSIDNGRLVWTAPVNKMAGGDTQATATELGGTYSVISETKASESSIKTRQTQTVIPASSIYYDDELAGGNDSVYTGETTRIDWNSDSGESVGKTIWYQFKGTRIDAYCTTDSTNGYVMAAVTDENGDVVTVNGERKSITIKGQSETPRYNVPTISFDGLDVNKTYYLKIYALRNANYQLDGIRVYHSADETDAAVQNAYEASGEQNAKYVNLRKLLLNSLTEESIVGNMEEGALFYTDSGTSYALTSSEYQTNSPKNEIYLKAGEKVAFQILGNYEKVEIGMSASDSKQGGGTVKVSNGSSTKNLSIANARDSYYRITPSTDGNVVIENNGTAMIAVTNVKLSGKYTPPANNTTTTNFSTPLRVSKSLMRYAADFSALPEDEGTAVENPAETEAPEETFEPVLPAEPDVNVSPVVKPNPTTTSKVQSLIAKITSLMKRLFGR